MLIVTNPECPGRAFLSISHGKQWYSVRITYFHYVFLVNRIGGCSISWYNITRKYIGKYYAEDF